MRDEILILVLGTVLGFLSALLIEFTKNRLEGKRKKQERVWETQEEKEKELREFLLSTVDNKVLPAWLTLVETNHTPSLFKKQKTDDVMSMDLNPENEKSEESSSKPTLGKFLLKKTQIIGRQDDCEIHLTDSTVSRMHAMIRYENNHFMLYDMSSKSGTFVNKRRVGKNGHTLHFGDRVQIGESVFVFDGLGSDYLPTNDKKEQAKITQPPRLPKSKKGS